MCRALQIPCDGGCNGSFQGKKFILVLYITTDPFTNLSAGFCFPSGFSLVRPAFWKTGFQGQPPDDQDQDRPVSFFWRVLWLINSASLARFKSSPTPPPLARCMLFLLSHHLRSWRQGGASAQALSPSKAGTSRRPVASLPRRKAVPGSSAAACPPQQSPRPAPCARLVLARARVSPRPPPRSLGLHRAV